LLNDGNVGLDQGSDITCRSETNTASVVVRREESGKVGKRGSI